MKFKLFVVSLLIQVPFSQVLDSIGDGHSSESALFLRGRLLISISGNFAIC
jgi:hypothetical protein